MRSKWYESNAPALQMALMKLIATPEELKKLSVNYNENISTLTTNLPLVITLESDSTNQETE